MEARVSDHAVKIARVGEEAFLLARLARLPSLFQRFFQRLAGVLNVETE